MIGVKDAVKIAFQLFQELYDTRKFENVLLEEVEMAQDQAAWLVTIGFYRRMPSVNLVESIGSKKYVRTYKTFHIDADSGEMISMKQGAREE
jgi:hypothetical protein